MSKKNLARTAIEGGRRGFNTWERRESNQLERVRTRTMMRAAARDPEIAESKPAPKRRPVHPEFNDKLNPVYRWIAAQHGRHWDDVRAEVHAKFDARTTAGRHIMYDHVLTHVNYAWHDNDWRGRSSYVEYSVVGIDGILRHVPGRRPPWKGRGDTVNKIIWEWAAGRLVRWVGAVPFWFVPTTNVGLGLYYRQDVPLSKVDLGFYDDLNSLERWKLTGQE